MKLRSLSPIVLWRHARRRLAPFVSKAELINRLAAIHGYSRYLEICTKRSGGRYAQIDRSILTSCHRLRYQCPADEYDGCDVDFSSANLDIAECLEQIRQRHLLFDIVLVDSWHEYETSYRDLDEAMKCIVPGGMIVVHDCLPPNEQMASPQRCDSSWCGVTYKAFVDFVIVRDELDYCTVDTDCGCGMIRKNDGAGGRASMTPAVSSRLRTTQTFPFVTWTRPEGDAELLEAWRGIGHDYAAAYAFFKRHHPALLKLRSVGGFIKAHKETAHAACRETDLLACP